MNGDDAAEPGTHKNEIALPDGRYLIYYTFDDIDDLDDDAADAADEGART